MAALIFYLVFGAFFMAAPDDGTGIDPHGITQTAVCGDEGNGFDPHGGPCTIQAQSDEGTGIDPHG